MFPPILRQHPTAQTSSFTALPWRIYRVDVGANQIEVTFPASPTFGMLFGYYIGTESTTVGSFKVAPGKAVEPDNPKINSVTYSKLAAGSGKYGLWMSGEVLVFRYVDSTVGWEVECDGRRQFQCVATLSGTQTNIGTGNTKILFDTTQINIGSMFNSTDRRIEVKRSNNYDVSGGVVTGSLGDGTRCDIIGWKNGSSSGVRVSSGRSHAGLNTAMHPTMYDEVPLVGTDYVEFEIGTTGSSFTSIANTATDTTLAPKLALMERF